MNYCAELIAKHQEKVGKLEEQLKCREELAADARQDFRRKEEELKASKAHMHFLESEVSEWKAQTQNEGANRRVRSGGRELVAASAAHRSC